MTVHLYNIDSKSASSHNSNMDYHHSADTQSTIELTPEASVQAYQTHQTMKMVKFIAYTMTGMTVILGSFILLSAYIQAGARCNCIRGYQSAESRNSPYYEPLTGSSSDDSPNDIRKLPIRIQMDGEAGELMKSNKKGRINCEVERKVATQIIASEPKMLITPYGNMTTDPRLIHMTGEKMFFSCSTGNPSKSKKGKQTIATILRLDRPIEEVSSNDIKDESKNRTKRETSTPTALKHTKECSCDCSC